MRRVVALVLLTGGVVVGLNAATVDKSVEHVMFEDWSFGLNTQADNGKLQTTMTPGMSNFYVDEIPGALVTRNGFDVVVNTPTLSKINFMFQYIKDSGDNELIVSDSSRVLTTRDFVTFVVIKATLTPTAVLRAAQIRGKVWFTNGVDPVFTWDGNQHQVLDGSNGTPNVPRTKFIAFYQERAWLYNQTIANYALYFSALASSATAAAIAPDDFRAWLVTNQLNIGQGDSLAGSGMDVFKGQLVLHKSNGAGGAIYTLFGTDEFTYFARKTNAEVGTNSNDSIVQLDNLEYFMAFNGVYGFDGSDTKRISDAIKPEMDTVVANLTRIISRTWDTKADFDRGSTITNATTTPSGFITLFVTTYTLTTTNEITEPSSTPLFLPLGSETDYASVVTTMVVPSVFTGRITRFGIWTDADSNPSIVEVYIKNTRTNDVCYLTFSNPGASDARFVVFADFPTGSYSDVGFSTVQFTGDDISAGNMQIKIKNGGSGGNGGFSLWPSTSSPNSSIWLSSFTNAAPTGQYISEISTSGAVMFWGQFIASDFPNGGLLSYYVRAATSPVNIATETWIPIQSGSNISVPIAKSFIQWAATLTIVGLSAAPMIDFVSLQYNSGSSDENRPIAVAWKARYILSVATETGTSLSVQFIKAKVSNPNPIAWTRWDGINIRSLVIYNDLLYAGSASSGAILRLDYGQNDNGAAINYFYDTPNISMTNRFFEKILQGLMLEIDRNGGGSLTVSRSANGGAYRESDVNLGGAGRLLYDILSAQEKGKYFKFRFSGSTLDRVVTLRSFGVLYKALNTR